MKKKLISVIIPCYNEAGNVSLIYASLVEHLPQTYEIEYFYVDDGSQDETLTVIKKLASKHKNVKYISFTRNFGHEYGIKAAMTYVKGDAAITLDADGQHPPKIIPQMLKRWEEGYKVVYARRTPNEQGSLIKNVTSTWFYKVINYLSETKLDEAAGDFRLIDKDVIEFIKTNPESTLFIRGLVAWSGFKKIGIDYKPRLRKWGKTKYTLSKMMRLAADAITSFSTAPLRFATIIGIMMSLLSGVYGLYALFAWIFERPTVIIGWPSVIISVLFIGGLQLMILGIIGEYIGKIFIETKRRPLYLIKEKKV